MLSPGRDFDAYLEQRVEHLRVRFLHLIKQDLLTQPPTSLSLACMRSHTPTYIHSLSHTHIHKLPSFFFTHAHKRPIHGPHDQDLTQHRN